MGTCVSLSRPGVHSAIHHRDAILDIRHLCRPGGQGRTNAHPAPGYLLHLEVTAGHHAQRQALQP